MMIETSVSGKAGGDGFVKSVEKLYPAMAWLKDLTEKIIFGLGDASYD